MICNIRYKLFKKCLDDNYNYELIMISFLVKLFKRKTFLKFSHSVWIQLHKFAYKFFYRTFVGTLVSLRSF